ncbi:MAG: hypothetical protein ABI690_26395 [Chloroflexota bacterium]
MDKVLPQIVAAFASLGSDSGGMSASATKATKTTTTKGENSPFSLFPMSSGRWLRTGEHFRAAPPDTLRRSLRLPNFPSVKAR